MKARSRKRAVGTRDRVISHLAAVGEITDPGGMASTSLAAAVGYPGSSVAFAQLLSGMERADLIEREIRGKRTYRIALTAAGGGAGGRGPGRTPFRHRAAAMARPGRAGAGDNGRDLPAQPGAVAAGGVVPAAGAAQGPGGFDYDELARRLLVQVVQQLAATPGAAGGELASGGGARSEPGGNTLLGTAPAGAGGGPGPEQAGLARTVASLEQKLASIQSRQRRLTAENAQLREQLQEAQQSLAEAQESASAGRGRLDSAEVRLLERLLAPLRDKGGRHEGAGAG
ncbi:MAG: hypothetical protein J2P35_12570 [Actinobacteria bacterium]|nr:hypothetical protein [Actinomycetota bacterium]